MVDLDARIAAFQAAPIGCGFLLIVEETGLAPEEAVQPEISVNITALAQGELSSWRADHDWLVNAVRAEGLRLASLARAILTRPEAVLWFGPLNRGAQRWISPDGSTPDPAKLVKPVGRLSNWERYAQKPAGGFFTSTAVGETCSWLAALLYVGEHPANFPLVQYDLEVSPDARIFEVEGPGTWHRLCTHYPAQGENGQLVPYWSAIAREWDAVHLTLGGLLTSEQVRVETPDGWSEHRGWDAEQTIWLRWCFTSVIRLPDLSAFPQVSPTCAGRRRSCGHPARIQSSGAGLNRHPRE